MSKKNKAAQAAASTAAKPVETAKAENNAKATKTEKENADATQQVAAKAATEKPAATQPKKEEKAQTTDKTDKQPAQKGAAQQSKPKKDKTPTVIAEEVAPDEAVRTLAKSIGAPSSSSTSSTDAKAMLAFVGHQRFTNNEELKKNFPEQYNAINQAINAVWFLGMIGVQQEMVGMQAEGKLQLIVSPEQVMPLQEMADMFGVKLASPKALPGATDGQLAIPFTASETEVPAQLKDPKLATLEVPELDIEKVGSDHEMICAALEYLLRKDRNLVVSLVETVEWYRKLCINNADNTDAKLVLDNRQIDEWINEIFHLVPVTSLLKGLGRSVYLYTKTEGSPVSAHCLVHGQLATTSEEDIVRVIRMLIQENFRYNLEDKIDVKGNTIKTEKVENLSDDKAIQATMGVLGVEYVDKLMSDYTQSVPEGATDEQLEEIKEARKSARKIISLVRANYYPGKVEPNNDQIRFAIGKIINQYRSPMDRIAEFEGSLPVLVGEYPKTEKEETAEEKKAKTVP